MCVAVFQEFENDIGVLAAHGAEQGLCVELVAHCAARSMLQQNSDDREVAGNACAVEGSLAAGVLGVDDVETFIQDHIDDLLEATAEIGSGMEHCSLPLV